MRALALALKRLGVAPSSISPSRHRPSGVHWRPGRRPAAFVVARVEAVEVRRLLSTIPVTTFSDVTNAGDGQTSLREAIALAAASPGDDVVEAPAGTYGLTAGELAVSDGSGRLTVRSVGGVATVNAQGTFNLHRRVFNIAANSNVELSGLTVTGGFLSVNNTYGAGIYNAGRLTLTDSTVTNNLVRGQGHRGGGIYNDAGTLTLTRSTVSANGNLEGNGQLIGGGIYNRAGSVTLTDSALSNNRAYSDESLTGGGGIYNAGGGAVTLTGSTVNGNSASLNGGGIYQQDGSLTLTASTVSANQNFQGQGGGIFAQSGSVALTRSTVADNVAGQFARLGRSGGGIYSDADLRVTDSTVSGNVAQGDGAQGGGIYNGGTLTMVGSTVSANHAAAGTSTGIARGGGVASNGTATLANCTISGNLSGNADSAFGRAVGGGVYSGSDLSLTNCTITDNAAAEEGGGGVFTAGTLRIANTIVAGNRRWKSWFEEVRVPDDVKGTATSDGHNLIGVAGTSTGWRPDLGDQVGTDAAPIDPVLGPLADNGGPTRTHALLPGSPAIEAGDTGQATDPAGNPLTTDQRGPGFARVVGSTVDIGAYEVQNLPGNAPTTTGIADVTVDEDAPDTTINLWAAFADAEDADNQLTYSVVTNTNPALFASPPAVNAAAGTLTLRYAAERSGTADLVVRATDRSGLSANAPFTVTVRAVEDPPVARDDGPFPTDQDTPRVIAVTSLLSNDSDPEGANASLFVASVTSGTGGTAALSDNGTPANRGDDFVTFTPAAGFTGNATFTYAVRDGTGAQSTATVTVAVRPAPVLSVNDATVTEGDDPATTTDAVFTVSLSNATVTRTVTVNWSTANGTAQAGSDYRAASGTLSFAPGETSKQVRIGVLGDTLEESDETFTVNLSAASAAATISDGSGVGTIREDDDRRPTADVIDVVPDPRDGPVESILIAFSEPVTGVDLPDLSLTRDGDPNELLLGAPGVTVTTADGGLTWRLAGLTGLTGDPGSYVLRLNPAGSGITDAAGNALASFSVGDAWRVVPPAARIVGRRVFYNDSAYDNNDPAPNAADDAAIDTAKSALLPNGAPQGPANVTSYTGGINGVMIDVASLPNDGADVGVNDVVIRTTSPAAPNAWSAGPAPSSVTVRPGAGAGGSDRVTIIWPDGAIANRWVEVTLLSNTDTGLAAADVFQFGNLVGDADASRAVNLADLGALRQAFGRTNLPLADGRSDFNRDGSVNLADFGLLRANFGRSLPAPPASSSGSSSFAAGLLAAADEDRGRGGVVGT